MENNKKDNRRLSRSLSKSFSFNKGNKNNETKFERRVNLAVLDKLIKDVELLDNAIDEVAQDITNIFINLNRSRYTVYCAGDKLVREGRLTGFRKLMKYGEKMKEVGEPYKDLQMDKQPKYDDTERSQLNKYEMRLIKYRSWLLKNKEQIKKMLIKYKESKYVV